MFLKNDCMLNFDQKFEVVFDVIDLPDLSLFEIIEKRLILAIFCRFRCCANNHPEEARLYCRRAGVRLLRARMHKKYLSRAVEAFRRLVED